MSDHCTQHDRPMARCLALGSTHVVPRSPYRKMCGEPTRPVKTLPTLWCQDDSAPDHRVHHVYGSDGQPIRTWVTAPTPNDQEVPRG